MMSARVVLQEEGIQLFMSSDCRASIWVGSCQGKVLLLSTTRAPYYWGARIPYMGVVLCSLRPVSFY